MLRPPSAENYLHDTRAHPKSNCFIYDRISFTTALILEKGGKHSYGANECALQLKEKQGVDETKQSDVGILWAPLSFTPSEGIHYQNQYGTLLHASSINAVIVHPPGVLYRLL